MYVVCISDAFGAVPEVAFGEFLKIVLSDVFCLGLTFSCVWITKHYQHHGSHRQTSDRRGSVTC